MKSPASKNRAKSASSIIARSDVGTEHLILKVLDEGGTELQVSRFVDLEVGALENRIVMPRRDGRLTVVDAPAGFPPAGSARESLCALGFHTGT